MFLPIMYVPACRRRARPIRPACPLLASPLMTENLYLGNAAADGPANRGWLLGHFMPAGDIRHSDDVEIKWGVHPKGEERGQWVTTEERTSLHVLISGR